MKRLTLWIVLVFVAVGFFGASPAYAPLVTVKEESASEDVSDDTDVVDLSDIPEAEGEPTWSPSFENQDDDSDD